MSSKTHKSSSKQVSKSSAKAQTKPSGDGSGNKSNLEWSEWYWQVQYQCWIRDRQKPNGEWDHDYDYSKPEGTVPRSSAIPLTASNIQLDSQQENESSHAGSPGYVTSGKDSSSQFTAPLLSPGEYSSSGRPTARYDSISTFPTISSLTRQFSNLDSSSAAQGHAPTSFGDGFAQQSIGDTPSIENSFQRSPQQQREYAGAGYMGASYGQSAFTSTQPSADFYYGMNTPPPPQSSGAVYQAQYNPYVPGTPSTSPYQAFPQSAHQEQSRQKHMVQGPSDESERNITTEIRGINKAGLHKDYKLHPSKDFTFGRVFKILWAEPAGQVIKGQVPIDMVETKHGEQAFAKIRRFIIAKQLEGHCLCLPILTYGGQGTKKSGAKPQDHAIVYIDDNKKKSKKGVTAKPPTEVTGEEKLSKKPIRIEPQTPRDSLDKYSRLNYAKIYTVEYNVKVCFIGSIHEKSIKYFTRDFNATHAPLPQDPAAQFSDEENKEEEAGGFDEDDEGEEE